MPRYSNKEIRPEEKMDCKTARAGQSNQIAKTLFEKLLGSTRLFYSEIKLFHLHIKYISIR